jgi:hypothetical protein
MTNNFAGTCVLAAARMGSAVSGRNQGAPPEIINKQTRIEKLINSGPFPVP